MTRPHAVTPHTLRANPRPADPEVTQPHAVAPHASSARPRPADPEADP